jgi:cysteine-S-conjugate beta-lyase
MKFGTKLIHNGNIDKFTGALSIPIYQASTFQQEDVDNPPQYEYGRSGNPTREALEETIAVLEGGDRAFAFASGMAAISGALSIFATGDHVIFCQDIYGGTHRIASKHFTQFGIEVTFVDATNLEEIKNNIKPNTKGLYLETPSNPLMRVTDLKGAAKIAKEHSIITIIDNTFMSPYLQRPIEHGIDIVVHSATKFIGGHSDVVGGVVVTSTKELSHKIKSIQNNFGAVLGPFDSWLLLRGVKTLKVRMDYHQKNAQKLAEWLVKHNKVAKVNYPGLEGHTGRDIHYAQADGAGAVLSFETIDEETAKQFLKNIKAGVVAVSLGGVETIVSYPVKMSHAAIPEQERLKLGINSKIIRVSIGLEDIEDLIEDFDRALNI